MGVINLGDCYMHHVLIVIVLCDFWCVSNNHVPNRVDNHTLLSLKVSMQLPLIRDFSLFKYKHFSERVSVGTILRICI